MDGRKKSGYCHGYGWGGRSFSSDKESLVKAGAGILYTGHTPETLVLHVEMMLSLSDL